jgi:hypothetical protein
MSPYGTSHVTSFDTTLKKVRIVLNTFNFIQNLKQDL